MGTDKKAFRCGEEMEDGSYAAAVGPMLPTEGVSEFALKITRSDDNNGTSMLLGVAVNDGTPLSFGVGKVWGLAPWNGRLLSFPNGTNRTRDSVAFEVRGDPLMRGDMRGTANGAVVRIQVDMDRRVLSFKVANATEWVLARDGGRPITLPAEGVRPFARCARVDDAISLSAISHVKSSVVAIPDFDETPRLVRPPPPPRQPPPPQQKSTEPPPVDDEAWRRREGELLTLVESLRGELGIVRKQLERERELRLVAEQAANAAQQRAEQALRLNQRRHSREQDASSVGGPSAREIEAGLLREVLFDGNRQETGPSMGGVGAGAGDRRAPSLARRGTTKSNLLPSTFQ